MGVLVRWNKPYKTTDELVTRKIILQSVYNQIKDKIFTRQELSLRHSPE